MSPWKSASLLVVAVLALAACGADRQAAKDAATPPASPNPCDLVAPTTIDDVVGPSLPLTVGGYGLPDKTTGSCSWSFGLDTKATDDVRRPRERQLHVDAETWKGDPCTEVKSGKRATAVSGLGDKAVLDLSVKGGVLRFCRGHQLAKLTWWAVDWQAGKATTVPDSAYEDTLVRLGREVLDRWDEARPVTINQYLPKRSEGPPPPDACELVTGETLATVGVDPETAKPLGTPSFGSTQCTWELGLYNVGHKPGEKYSRYLSVAVQSYGGEWGFKGAERASTTARQFSHGWQVAADSTLGGGAVLVDDHEGQGVAAYRAFTIAVTLRARDGGWTEKSPRPSDEKLTEWTRLIAADVMQAMPR